MGGKFKISRAPAGDMVNLASRIQELNKQMDSDTTIGSETYRSLKKSRTFSKP